MDLNYKVFGEGKNLIVLHGLFGSLDNWVTLGKKWAENYRVWLVDQRNHGKSPHSDDFSYQLMASDLHHFIQQHEIIDPIILGHSMGGKTAMEYALLHSDDLHKLIVVDIAPVSYEVHHHKILEALHSFDPNQLKSRNEADELMKKLVSNFGERQFLLKNLERKSEGGYQWKFNLEVLSKNIVPISEWNIREGQFNKATLFIKGELSKYILPEYGLAINEKFPNYQLKEIKGAGHWVHAEMPELFFELVSQFMKD